MSAGTDRAAAPARWASLFAEAAGDLQSASPAVAERCRALADDCRRLADLYRPRPAISVYAVTAEAGALLQAIAQHRNMPAAVVVARAADGLGLGVRGQAGLRLCLQALQVRGLVWAVGPGQRLELTATGRAALLEFNHGKGTGR